MRLRNTTLALGFGAMSVIGFTAFAASSDEAGMAKTISPRVMADALHLVMDSDRAVYTQKVVNRLAAKEKVIKASEHFDDEKALVLPAQMFRFGSEMVAKRAEKKPYVPKFVREIEKERETQRQSLGKYKWRKNAGDDDLLQIFIESVREKFEGDDEGAFAHIEELRRTGALQQIQQAAKFDLREMVKDRRQFINQLNS